MPVETPRGAQHAEIAEQPLLVVVGQDRCALSRLEPERDQPHADSLGRAPYCAHV